MVTRIKESRVGNAFIPLEYQIDENPYFWRFQQNSNTDYRVLNDEEIIALKSNNNYSSDWGQVYVSDEFNPEYIRNSKFYG